MYKEAYTSTEWRTLQFAPLWVYAAVAFADGKADKDEASALATELAEWAQYKEPLVQEVLLSVGNDLNNILALFHQDSSDLIRGLGSVADILEKNASKEQKRNFKNALLLLGHNIAEASGGGLFGLGNKISKEERAALGIIKMALRAT